MKKYFYLAAVSAMMLTACSSENDVVQPTPAQPTNPVAVQQQAVGFDVYLPAATAGTRAGDAGIQTTSTLQADGKGFGVFAQYSNDTGSADGSYNSSANTTNFMWNEHVSYSSSSWSYSPLKYWPNETTNDSQSPAATSSYTDKLSFFAYAPYVRELGTNYNGKLDIAGDNTTDKYSAAPVKDNSKISAPADEGGIEAVIANNTTGDPWVRYQIATDPSKSVDLLWGVAPSGGLSYDDVRAGSGAGGTTSVGAGLPLIDLIKPAKDERIKFLFKHALARIGMTVVAAIDQISAGGSLNASETKIFVESVQLDEVTSTKVLKKKGALNLNNTSTGAGVAKWEETSGDVTGLLVDNSGTNLNPVIKYTTNANTSFTSGNAGVTATEVPVIKDGSGNLHYFMVIPGNANTDLQVTITYYVITKDDKLSGGYSEVKNVITKKVTIPTLTNNKAYNLKLILGLTSVKLDAEVADWEIMGSTPVDLPQNNQ